MKTISFLIAILCVPTFLGAQDKICTTCFGNFVDAIGDQPGAHPCSTLTTLLSRASKARLSGMSEVDARKLLKQYPSGRNGWLTEDAIRAIYDNPKGDKTSLFIKAEDTSNKCEVDYKLVPGPYESMEDFAKKHDKEIKAQMKGENK